MKRSSNLLYPTSQSANSRLNGLARRTGPISLRVAPRRPLQTETYYRALVEAENNLRFAIGRYLHDGPQQHLHRAINLLRQQAELLESDPTTAATQIGQLNQDLLKLLNQADQDLTLARREVLPTVPIAGTLSMTVESYVLDDFPRLCPQASFCVDLELTALDECFDQPAAQVAEKMLISLFVREALKNAYKHAEASRVVVESQIAYFSGRGQAAQSSLPGLNPDNPVEGDYLRISVKDNGRGFDPARLVALAESSRHRSFYDFEARARMLGGFSRLVTCEGLGSRWEIYLPLSNPAAHNQNKAVALSA